MAVATQKALLTVVRCFAVVVVSSQPGPANIPTDNTGTKSNGPKQASLFIDDGDDLFAGTQERACTRTHTLTHTQSKTKLWFVKVLGHPEAVESGRRDSFLRSSRPFVHGVSWLAAHRSD